MEKSQRHFCRSLFSVWFVRQELLTKQSQGAFPHPQMASVKFSWCKTANLVLSLKDSVLKYRDRTGPFLCRHTTFGGASKCQHSLHRGRTNGECANTCSTIAVLRGTEVALFKLHLCPSSEVLISILSVLGVQFILKIL